MNFVSVQFFFLISFTGLVFFFAKPKFRPFCLLCASFIFYGAFSIPLLGLILISTSIDYFSSLLMAKSSNAALRKALLYSTVFINLSFLLLFKYANWFMDLHVQFCQSLGLHCSTPVHFEFILPLGISFYTLEAISYLVDVYRGSAAAKSWWHYNFYIMWFPHLISGPIVRFDRLSKQYVNGIEKPTMERVKHGLALVLLGYFCKLVIADAAASLADPIFSAPENYSALNVWAGGMAFISELYFDFYGYTQIARGISLLFNIELPINFNHPALSATPAEFFQRWHVSLSQWLHDYVFLPMGGRSKNAHRSIAAILVTMTMAGLWHGANLKYLVLGVYFGLCVCVYHVYRRNRSRLFADKVPAVIHHPVYRASSWALMQAFFVFAAFIFRCTDVGHLSRILERLCMNADYGLSEGALFFGALLAYGFFARDHWGAYLYQRFVLTRSSVLQAHVAACAAILCWIGAGQLPKPFIYFQF